MVSLYGLAFGATGLCGLDSQSTSGIVTSTGGVVVPGFRAHDLFNLVVGLPALLAAVWLARRGSDNSLLLWPGVLVYILYTYTTYLVGAPFGPLFLAYILLVVLEALVAADVLTSVESHALRDRLIGAVPARSIGALQVAFALMTLAQDATGAISTALAGPSAAAPLARHVWTADLAIEVPAMLFGGVLLWRRTPLGYTVGAGLLLQFGLTPLALAVIIFLQPWLTGSPAELGLVTGLLLFAVLSFAPLVFFLRGGARRQAAI
jgi:hypothetical protein